MKYINKGKTYSAVKEELKEGQEVVVLKGFESQYGEDFVSEGEVYPLQEDVERYRQHGDVYCVDIHKPNASEKVPSNWEWLTLDSVLPVVPVAYANVVVATGEFCSGSRVVKKGEVFNIVSKEEVGGTRKLTARIDLRTYEDRYLINGAVDYSDKFVYAYDSDLPVKEEKDVEEDAEEEVKEDMTTIDLLENEVIYIAAPISTEAEVMYVNKLAETLRTIGYEVYSASEDEEINDKTNNPKAETIYTKDFDAIDDADIVLFVETGKKQVGSHIELGKVLEMRRKGIDVELIAFTNNYRLDKPQTQEGMASESINHLELGGILVEGTFVHGMTDGVIQHLIARKWGV